MAMDPSIVALIDGSIYSQSICDHTSWIANRMGVSVQVIHALGRREVSSDPANLSGNIGLGARSSLLEELADLDRQKAKLAQKRGRAILSDAKQSLQDAGVGEVSTRLRIGELVETILDLENSGDADLIVIGKRGEGADFDKLHLGSNLERVARSSSKPVLVTSREFQPIKRVLIAFDAGPSVLKAIDYFASTQAFTDLHCHLLMAGTSSKNTRRELEGAEALLKSTGYSVSSSISPGQPENVIVDTISREGFDLLLMGAYGHSRMRNLIIGSTTTEMIRSCRIPVLLFR